MPGNAHGPKLAAVMEGLDKRGASKGSFKINPLEGAEVSGDPMQPAAAGILLGASQYCPVLLGGGTQMAAVLALAMALGKPGSAALATTRWVSADPTADLKGLAAEIDKKFGLYNIPYLASNLSFKDSHHPMMQKYEEGYVKEGVGAGAAAIAACLYLKCAAQDILPEIEGVYERLVLGLDKK
jgi:NaMN:DMB phosphoribosyltransferase